MVGVITVLLYKEPHYSAIGIICFISAIMIFAAGMKITQILAIGPPVLAVGIFYLLKEEYRVKRLLYVFKPWEDLLDSGWQPMQSLYAICSGGLFGVGLGNSTQKHMYIPEPHNDFIFSIWAEETGFIGAMFVCILFAILIWRGISIAMRAPDMYGSLMALGITSMFAIQIILNIAIISATFPVTGMPLPLFSYGGTALIVQLGSLRSANEYIEKLFEIEKNWTWGYPRVQIFSTFNGYHRAHFFEILKDVPESIFFGFLMDIPESKNLLRFFLHSCQTLFRFQLFRRAL